jgi:uncharacterized protein (DUF2236 family)
MAKAGKLSQEAVLPTVDFMRPAGEPALAAPESVSWRIFKNPVALYIGGIAAVLLELAEPRVRSGVWDHTTFRVDPIARMKRTGLAAMVTVYGARSVAEEMIKGITRMHARVRGETPDGRHYRALEPELMDWVQATASYGFLQAYHRFVAPLSATDRDRFYAEARTGARLYGAPGAPLSEAQQQDLFEEMLPQLEPSSIVFEFLTIMRRTRALPWALQPLQPLYLRAAVSLLPQPVLERLQLGDRHRLYGWQRQLIRRSGALADRIVLREAPPALACRRLGLTADYLYK